MLDFFVQFKQLHHGHSLHLCGSLTSRLSGLTAEESGTGRCSRFQLMVVAQSPLLVLPLSAQLLAVDLGILEIQFQAAGAEGTTSTRKLNNLRSRELGGGELGSERLQVLRPLPLTGLLREQSGPLLR